MVLKGGAWALVPTARARKIYLGVRVSIARRHNFKTFYGLIEGLKPYADNLEELRKNASKVVEIFEQDTGIKLRQ